MVSCCDRFDNGVALLPPWSALLGVDWALSVVFA